MFLEDTFNLLERIQKIIKQLGKCLSKAYIIIKVYYIYSTNNKIVVSNKFSLGFNLLVKRFYLVNSKEI